MTSDTTPNPGDGATQTPNWMPPKGGYGRLREDSRVQHARLTEFDSDLHELPFITTDADHQVVSHWRSSLPDNKYGKPGYIDDSAIGTAAAWSLIWYMRKHGLDGGELFGLVVKDMIDGGVYGPREVGFIGTLGHYMATGYSMLTVDVVAMHEDDAPTPNHAEASNPDPVLPMWREVLRMRCLINSNDPDKEDDRDIEELVEKQIKLEHKMADTPATSVQGLYAKIECLMSLQGDIDVAHAQKYLDCAFLKAIQEDGARLAAGGGS